MSLGACKTWQVIYIAFIDILNFDLPPLLGLQLKFAK